jgi:hypothetical protein
MGRDDLAISRRRHHPRRLVRRAPHGDSKSPMEHLVSIGAVLLALVVLIKTYSAANYSLTTASALLTAAPVTVVLGTLTSYEYDFLPLIGLSTLCWFVFGWKNWKNRDAAWRLLSFTAALGALLFIVLSPLRNLLYQLTALAIVIAVHRLLTAARERTQRARPSARRELPPVLPLSAAVGALFVVLAAALVLRSLHNLWLPFEVVTVRPTAASENGNTVVGSVLSYDDRWTTVLKAADRKLLRLPSDSVLSRRICHLNGAQPAGEAPLIDIFHGYHSPNVSCQSIVAGMTSVVLVDGSLPSH